MEAYGTRADVIAKLNAVSPARQVPMQKPMVSAQSQSA